MKTKQIGKTRITRGPFTWIYAGDRGGEVWDLRRGRTTECTMFCLKNYGGTPGEGFAGWKLVSGGPFDTAGAYATLESAATGVVDFLTKYYIKEATDKIRRARATIRWATKLKEQMR
jgi:hypothetical protein